MPDNIAAFRPSYRPAPADGPFSQDMRRMMMVAGGLTGGLMLVVVLWHMAGRHSPGPVPVIEAQAGPVRVKPEHPGGMVVAGASFGSPQDQTEKLAPPAEEPQIAALKAQLHAAHKKLARQQAALAADHVSPRIAPPAPVKRAAAIAPLDLAPPIIAVPFPMPPISAALLAGTAVQLAAFDSEAAARADWAALQKKWPALLGARKPEIEQASFIGHPIWRLRTGGFPSITSAATFCARLRDKGMDCKVAAF